jgi:hypothetical protein
VHAAGESSPGGLPSGTHAVCLAVSSEEALEQLSERLTLARVPFVRVVESDAPYEGQLMALGCLPGRKETLRRHLSALPLLR